MCAPEDLHCQSVYQRLQIFIILWRFYFLLFAIHFLPQCQSTVSYDQIPSKLGEFVNMVLGAC